MDKLRKKIISIMLADEWIGGGILERQIFRRSILDQGQIKTAMSSQAGEEQELGFQFSWRVSRAERERKKFNEVIRSPVFATATNGIRYLWLLRLYPKGYKHVQFPSADEQPNVSLFLKLQKDSIKEGVVEAKYQLFIQGGTRGQKTLHAFNLSKRHGHYAFCLQNEIDTVEWVEFGARIWLKESAFDVERLFPVPQFQNVHTSRLLYEQVVLGDQSMGSCTGDVTIIVSDGTKIPCHQLFLWVASPVFEAMFQRGWAEGQKKEIRIDDVPLGTLKQLLFFCYVDGMPEGWKGNAEGLLRAAHKYDVEKVVGMCEKQLAKRLELGNAVEMLEVAVELELQLLGMQATQLLVDNWSRVSVANRRKLGPDAFIAVTDGLAYMMKVTLVQN